MGAFGDRWGVRSASGVWKPVSRKNETTACHILSNVILQRIGAPRYYTHKMTQIALIPNSVAAPHFSSCCLAHRSQALTPVAVLHPHDVVDPIAVVQRVHQLADDVVQTRA